MSDGPKLYVTNGVTGEQREYEHENMLDLEESQNAIDDHFQFVTRARKNQNKSRQPHHIRLMQAKTFEYLESDGFKPSYSAVYLLMLSKAKYGGRVPLSRAQMKDKLNCSRQTVARAIKHLIENGMVTEGEHEGREYYFIPTNAAEKGRHEIKPTEKHLSALEIARARWSMDKASAGGKT